MVKIEFNGKPFDPSTFEDAILAAALQAAAEQVRRKVGSIRDPDTGEFPTVVVYATPPSTIAVRVEGSDAVVARVLRVLEPDAGVEAVRPPTATGSPKVFLSYATEDREIASLVATSLQSAGIDTWWDMWEISAGDSLRQKIDAGIGGCTHFVVLVTPTSIQKPWVNQEMDAGFVRMLDSKARFVPLRIGLAATGLPPLLRGMYSPEVLGPEYDIQQLINDIHGTTRKPPIGRAPQVNSAAPSATGISPAAMAVARKFVEDSTTGMPFDVQFSSESLATLTGLTRDDLSDAIHELSDLLQHRQYSGGDAITAEAELYARFDALWQPWDPTLDALTLASALISDQSFPRNSEAIAEQLGWAPRRLNPALAYLMTRRLAQTLTSIGDGSFLAYRVNPTDATRRYVKSRSIL